MMKTKLTHTHYTGVLGALTGILLSGIMPLYAASEMDQRIESTAKDSYVYRTYLKDDSIKTQSKDGVVTLTGSVLEESHISLAENTVANLPGVMSVDNQLEFSGEQPAEYSDTWINMKVRTALLFHRNVSITDTSVMVKDGIVTLKGEASSQIQKDLTTKYAKDVEHVVDVVNNMTVNKPLSNQEATFGDKIDDASITAQIKVALLSHRSTSALRTDVSTADGIVTLSGMARNDAERQLVTELATDIKGVIRVVNSMTLTIPVTMK